MRRCGATAGAREDDSDVFVLAGNKQGEGVLGRGPAREKMGHEKKERERREKGLQPVSSLFFFLCFFSFSHRNFRKEKNKKNKIEAKIFFSPG